ncbi:MAG: class I SAM-dependent methyltransferase [Planctomycetota bacterium]
MRTSDPQPGSATVAVAFDRPRQRERAELLAKRLNLPLAQRLADAHDLHLAVAHRGDRQDDRLELRVNAHLHRKHPLTGGHPVAAEPYLLDTTSPAGRKINAPLFKAMGIRKGEPFRPLILDATAGFGEDAWLLAAAGCSVVAYERHPIVHALLEDGLARAATSHPEVDERITLQPASLLTDAKPGAVDVIYLDPMFPSGRKTAEKKPMRVFRWLLGDDDDADTLLPSAFALRPRRVVVKRPRHAPPLAGREPVHSHQAKALRFDVYSVS